MSEWDKADSHLLIVESVWQAYIVVYCEIQLLCMYGIIYK